MFYKVRKAFILGVAVLANIHFASYSFALEEAELSPKITQDVLNNAREIISGAYANLEKKPVSYTSQKSADGKAPIINIDKMIKDAPSLFEKSCNNDEMPNLMVFVSLSMPKKSILQLSEQVNRAGGVLVLRGAHKGSLKATVAKLMALSKEGVSAVIDPKSFANYQVSVVPTFVLRDRSVTNATSLIDRMEGNVPLEYVLERFARDGQQNKIAKDLLNRMKGQV
ncbi:MAG: type-F conjugative transfer system pilin assembly protein TrbC [Alphaproteobacteria bacterium]|nr:type-F conjugative transfer system pilin assembly protein TrbC [Candidatus Jidaibacter sp.]